MPDKNYTIRIMTSIEPKGLDGAKSGTDDLTKSTQKSAEAVEAQGKSFINAGSEAREFHGILGRLVETTPQVGLLIKAVLSPLGALMTFATVAFAKAQESIKALNESLVVTPWESYKTALESAQKGLAAAKIEAAGFAAELNRIGKAAQTASEQVDRLAGIHKAQQGAEEAIAAAKEKLEMAQAATINDPVARAEKELEIQNRYAVAAERRTKAAEQLAIAEDHRKLANEQLSETGLQGALRHARDDADKLGTKETLDEKIRIEESRLAAIRADKQKRQDTLDQLELVNDATNPTAPAARRTLKRLLDSDTETENKQQAYVETLHKNRTGQVEAIAAANATVSDLEAELKATTERIKKLKADVSDRDQTRRIESNQRQTVFGIEEQTRTFKTAADGGAADAAGRFLKGGKLNEVDIKMLDTMLKFVGADRGHAEEALRLLANHTLEIQQIRAQIKALNSHSTQSLRLLPGAG